MKILQIVTLVTPDGAYGGPLRVATNQAKALADRRIDTTLIASARGFGHRLPSEYDGQKIRLFRARQIPGGIGFAGVYSPGMMVWLLRHARNYDVIHIHCARDLVTLPAALLAKALRVPIVLQTHGMIDRSDRKLARVVDVIATTGALRAAKLVLHLTPEERIALVEIGAPEESLRFLPNGVPSPAQVKSNRQKPGLVLYLARLEERKRPEMFVRLAADIHRDFPGLRFELVGPDEGQGDEVRRLIRDLDAESYVSWSGPLPAEETGRKLAEASLYVLPSVNEPFPMSVLESLSVGTPAIVSSSCGLASSIKRHGSGVVFDESLSDLIQVTRFVLSQSNRLSEMSERAIEMVQQSFNMDSIAGKLAQYYRQASAGIDAMDATRSGSSE